MIEHRGAEVQRIAKRLRTLVKKTLGDVTESFYGGARPMAMYRTVVDVCWIQPLTNRCNFYVMNASELEDPDGYLEGSSERYQFVKIDSIETLQKLPLDEWMTQIHQRGLEIASQEQSFNAVLEKMRQICTSFPQGTETETWGKPHFRVADKIFAGCGEVHGRAQIGLKSTKAKSRRLMQLPGITKAAYSRPDDGWISIDPSLFDDWSEIEQLLIESFCWVAPKKIAAQVERADL